MTAAKILSRITRNGVAGCWNWQGAVVAADRPYGRLTVGSRKDGSRRVVKAHRYSYEMFVGPIPAGMAVCHRCDNPRCVNPDHLFVGTWKDNADDRDRKGRNKFPSYKSGEQVPGAKLTNEQADEIRASSGPSWMIAEQYGISGNRVRAIRRGEGYVTSPPKEKGE